MKTVSWRVSNSYANGIVNALTKEGFEPLCIPGSLQDNYICDLGEECRKYKIGRFKLRKYLLIREVYLNECSSGLELELTDDDSVFKAWERHYENWLKEQEGEIA